MVDSLDATSSSHVFGAVDLSAINHSTKSPFLYLVFFHRQFCVIGPNSESNSPSRGLEFTATLANADVYL